MTDRGCVNHMMHDAVVRDCVWVRAFKQDSKEDVELVLKSEWLAKKWSMLNPKEESA